MSEPIPPNLKARMKASYDAIAEDYNTEFYKIADTLRIDYLGRLVALLQSNGNDTAAVLELGCGAGVPATKYLLEQEKPVFTLTGNDISTTQLNLARSNLAQYHDRLTLLEGDMLALSFPAANFDAVTGFYSIIHLPREEQIQLMSKIVEWIKPGGYFLANFLIEDMSTLEEDKWLGHEKGWMFWSGWGEKMSVEMVENVGFTVLLKEVRQAVDDATFVWVLARKGES
ncbi:methyltransferase [Decorospora gaudefroyi]|uniref:Methyltransferase n=1 Tax=Decorospora gaudefroyi TaxID=184978 RepID=A0A6A5K6T1_9PLEO|nr:methyltransferase [Decorospora gaudefroyi]